MNLGLENKVALITGGSHGIGLAIKKALEKEGVLVNSLSRNEGYDLMKEEDLNRAKKLAKYCNILINNIGGGGTWDQEFYVDVMYKNYGIMAELTSEYLKKPRCWGRVITISSIYGKEKGHNPGFTAAKSAQISYMKCLAGKVLYTGTTFNTICPGHIDVGKSFPDKPQAIGKPEDIANLVIFLCSDKANHINGACITVDGGESYSF